MNNKVLRSLLLALFSLQFLPCQLFCQESIIGSVISKESRKAIPNANVCIYDSKSRTILGFTFSAQDGSFVLKPAKVPKDFYLEVSSMGYGRKEKSFESFPAERLIFEMETADFKLKEVSVTAPKVNQIKDTINYITSGFAKEQDRSIGDVLKRIPGIDVSKGGQVSYKEKPINALYIDGKNLLDGHYGIATQNIRPDIVSMIQIFENHQPIKVLEKFSPSENAAINLKLGPKAKSEWISSADLGAGVDPFLWDARLLVFQFGGKFQTMNIFKSNNRGKDITWEFREQYLGSASETQLLDSKDCNLVNVTGLAVPPIEEERNMFNESHLFSTNSLFSLRKDLQAVVKFNYLYDYQKRWQNQRTEYILDDAQNIVVEENNSFRGFANSPELDMVIKSNTTGIFLQNRINARARFSNNFASTDGTMNIDQKAKLRQYSLSEIFSLIKPVRKSIFKVSSNTNLRSLPQTLTISSENMRQSVDFLQVLSNSKAGIQRAFGNFSTELNGGVNLIFQKMESAFSPCNQNNNIDWSFTETYIASSVRYEKDALRITVDLPVKMQNSKFRSTPGIYVRYKFSPFWEGRLTYNFNTSHTDIIEMNGAWMLTNYRSLAEGYEKMLESRHNIFTVSGQYNNPLKLLNIHASANYNKNTDGYTISVKYLDFYNYRTILPDERESSSLSFKLNATKSFFDMPLLLDIKADCSIYDNSMIQQEKETFFKTYMWNVKPRAEATFNDALSVDFNAGISVLRRTSERNGQCSSTIVNYNPNMQISYKLSERLKSQVKFDYYINELTDGDYTYCLFTDLRTVYKTGKGELSADCINILNKREYRYTTFSELSTIERTFKLRPWNLMISYSFTF